MQLIPIRDINPVRSFPVVTVGLIALNVVGYLATTQSIIGPISDEAAFRYGAVPCDIVGECARLSAQLAQSFPERSPWLSIFTSMFMHANILHIAGNMLFLWVFGNNVEDRLGRVRFPIFYLVSGVGAAFAHIIFSQQSQVPTIGASGAVSGVLGAYALLWPGATIISIVPVFLFFFSVRTPAIVSIGLWFLLQLAGGAAGFGRVEGGGVAYLAHIGGFVTGLALIIPFGGRRSER